MFAAWTVGINLITRSNFGMVAGNIARQAGAANVQVAALSRRMSGLKEAGVIAERAFMGIGLVSAAGFAIGIKGAADLQSATIQVAIALGRQGRTLDETMEKMKDFRQVALSMSDMSGQSIVDSMKLLATMAGPGGITAEKLLNKGKFQGSFAQVITQYADVQKFGHGVEFSDSVKTATTLAHDLQWFKPEEMAHGLSVLNDASIVSTHGVKMLATQIRSFAPSFRKAGMTPEDTVHFATWADRMGFGTGRGGTGLNMMVKNLIAPRGKVKTANMYNLGIFDDAKGTTSRFINPHTGKIDLVDVLNYLSEMDQKSRHGGVTVHGRKIEGQLFDQFFNRAFDTNSSNVLGTLATHGGLSQSRRIKEQVSHIAPLDVQQRVVMQGLNEQTQRLTSSFVSLMAILEGENAKRLAGFVKGLADGVGGLAKFFHEHKGLADAAGTGLGVAGVIAAGLFMKKFGFGIAGHFGKMFGMKHGGFSLWRHIGGSGGKHAAEEVASHSGGLLRGGLMRGIVDMLTFKTLRTGAGKAGGKFLTHMPGFQVLGESLGKVAMMALKTGGPIKLVAEFLAKLGLRAIPLVGEVLLLVDVLKFMGSHVKDIGYYIGKAARWIHDNGWSLIKSAFTYVLNGIVDLIKFILNPMNLVHFIGGLGKAIGDGFSGHSDDNQHKYLANQHALAAQSAKHPHKLNTGGRILGNGVAMLHSNEIVVKDRTVKNMDRYFAKGGGGGIAININAPYHAAPGNDAQSKRNALDHARQVANETARVISATMRTSMRSAGSTIATLGMSPLELNPSV